MALALKVLTRRARVVGVLPKRLEALFPSAPPRTKHIYADTISAASTASNIVAMKPTVSSSIDIGYRAYSSFFTLNPNTMFFYMKALYKMLDSAYGAEFHNVISIIWKYTPVMLMVERALSAGEIKVGSAKMAEMNEKIEKLPEITVRHLILQMDRLGMKEVLKVTGLDKKKAEFQSNMSEFEKNRLELELESEFDFEKHMSACEKHVSKFELDHENKVEEPYAVPISISTDRVELFRKKLSAFEKPVSTFELDEKKVEEPYPVGVFISSDRLGLFRKKLSAFEKPVSTFELLEKKFKDPYAETMRDYFSAACFENTVVEELYIELDRQDIVVELTESLGSKTVFMIPIRGKLVRMKFGAASIGNSDGEDGNECNDGLRVKKEEKDDAEEGRKAT